MILAIIGNGGHTVDILAIIKDVNRKTGGWVEPDDIVILDDKPSKTALRYSKSKSIEDAYIELMSRHGKELRYLIGVNSSTVRRDLVKRLDAIHARPAGALIHPTAVTSGFFQVPDGCVLGPYAVLSNAKIGRHVHMNTHTSINQTSVIGDYSTLSPGARVCGDCNIGEAVQMGANSTVINMVNVCDDVILGAGAVVTKDIVFSGTYVGTPAKYINQAILLDDSKGINV